MAKKQIVAYGPTALRGVRLAPLPADALDNGEPVTGFAGGSTVYSEKRWDALLIDHCEFNGMRFMSCSFMRAQWEQMRFINGDLSNCRFERPIVAFAEIARSRLTGSTFEDGEIRNTIFSSSKLDLSSFRYCKLFNCQFVKCSLREVDWQGAELNAVSFLECDLSGSQFSQASFDKADLRSSSIGGAAFSLENLRGLIAEPSQCAIFATMLGVTVADPIYPDTEMG